jgi:tetratricopeptide (TPR) repeat protein
MLDLRRILFDFLPSGAGQRTKNERGEIMFLTRKGIFKIAAMSIIYFLLGVCFFALAGVSAYFQIDVKAWHIRLGAIACLVAVLLVFWGRYAEGKGKWLNRANKLVRNELRPAAFIGEYDALKNSPDLVVGKPSMELLQALTTAYDLLDDRENALATVNEMIAIAPPKRKTYARLLKASMLYSYGYVQEGEAFFNEARSGKCDFLCIALIDTILKSDRAMAMGDYKTAESHALKALAQGFPKPDPLMRLFFHFRLGEVYERMDEPTKAVPYYQYCAAHGGETALREAAVAALERLR